MFSTIDKVLHNYHFISKTVTTLSVHNQISTLTTISLQLLLHIKFYEQLLSLINKLQPLSYQSTSNITPRLPLHSSQPTPKYTTLLHYSHNPNTQKNFTYAQYTDAQIYAPTASCFLIQRKRKRLFNVLINDLLFLEQNLPSIFVILKTHQVSSLKQAS